MCLAWWEGPHNSSEDGECADEGGGAEEEGSLPTNSVEQKRDEAVIEDSLLELFMVS